MDIVASAETTAQTGVEMEALTAVSVAALTVYDMAKAIDKGMVITDVTLVEKTKVAERLKAAVLTVSDRVSRGEAEDGSGDTLEELLRADGYEVERRLVPDEADQIAAAIVELAEDAALVLTTGGTGLAARDVTPEATRSVLEREAPGISQAIRADSIAKTPHGLLSRGAGRHRRHARSSSTSPARRARAATATRCSQPALTHALKLLAVSKRANPLVTALCREAIPRAIAALRALAADLGDADARSAMSYASLCGGIALANAGLGAVHGFAAPLGGMFPAPHGAVCARLLPFVIEANQRGTGVARRRERACRGL